MIAYKNRVTGVNDVSVGSPSRILMVLLISLGMTTRPRSSILLTIPVAFMNLFISFGIFAGSIRYPCGAECVAFSNCDVSICFLWGFILDN